MCRKINLALAFEYPGNKPLLNREILKFDHGYSEVLTSNTLKSPGSCPLLGVRHNFDTHFMMGLPTELLGQVTMVDAYSFSTYDPMDITGTADLQQRLNLYQVFLKLYEHHRGLLDEILHLEDASVRPSSYPKTPFIQGMIRGERVYLITNLIQGTTTALEQPQGIWTIGRDSRQASLLLRDQQVSRCHAAIRYLDGEFQLVDLQSRNGSYLNGEPVRRAIALEDGDTIRLGNISFSFFICRSQIDAAPIPDSLMDYIEQSSVTEPPTDPLLPTLRPPSGHGCFLPPAIPDDTDLCARSLSN